MEKSLENFEESVRNIRTGSVTSSFIDTFKIHYFGQNVPIKHLAYTANEKGLVVIKPYDLSVIGLIEKSLKEAGLNAYLFSKQAVAVSVPPMSGDERERVKAHVKKLGEEAKISIRNIRKQCRKDFEGTEDQKRDFENKVQKTTDIYIETIDEIVVSKLKDLSE
jgi:ribosome recycling factor